MSRLLIVISILLLCGACSPPDGTTLAERWRPAYHFTPAAGWMNDPNGMFYYEGTYHLFYQHYPDSTVWGPMHWGHATSKDLITWEHAPIALYPDSLGYIFSGSAVVDWNNTSGFGSLEHPPVIAIFTYHHDQRAKEGKIDFQSQGIAYSLDSGKTWTKYAGNPVLPNPGIRDFRDPKIIWYQQTQQWLLALAVVDHISFYASKDLKTWTKLSDFGQNAGAHGGVWECPDFFPLADDKQVTKWVLLVSINPGGPQGGSATQYFIGDFNGTDFAVQDTLTRWIDYGPDNYAGVTISDMPDDERIFIGWMSNWQYAEKVPTMEWRSAMTIPRELALVEREGKYELNSVPFGELHTAFDKPVEIEGGALLRGPSLMELEVDPSNPNIEIVLGNDFGEKTVLSGDGKQFVCDRMLSGVTAFHPDFPKKHTLSLSGIEVWKLSVYMDAASLEIFINDGERVMTEIIFPSEPYNKVSLKNCKGTLRSLKSQ